MKNLTRTIRALLAGLLLVAAAAAGQEDPDTAIRFNLSTPGARSLAMGGAFVGLADDATAAYTNPAGLTSLTVGGSEVAVEWRLQISDVTFVDRGHVSTSIDVPGFVTDEGFDQFGPGIELGNGKSETSGLSFLSFAWVLPRGVTVAAYRHELGNFSSEFQTSGFFIDDDCGPGRVPRPNGLCLGFRSFPRQSRTVLDIVNWGASAAWEVDLPEIGKLESTLSFGLGVSYYDAEVFSRNQFFDLARFEPDLPEPVDLIVPGAFFGPPSYAPDNLRFESSSFGRDDDYGINAGLLWRLGRERRWSVGAVFRGGPKFSTDASARSCLLDRDDFDFTFVLRCLEFTGGPQGVFTIPDVIGVGAAYRTGDGLGKMTLDYNRVRYSQRLVDYTKNLRSPDTPDFDARFEVDPVDLTIDDADQLHIGFERLILVVESLFVGTLRLGAWYEPYHDVRYLGAAGFLAASLSRPEDDQLHLSAGVGLAVKEDFQIDIAADFADNSNSFSFSLVRFF